MRRGLARLAAAAALLAPLCARGRVEAGATVEDAALPALDGARRPLLAPDRVNVVVFFRAGQERSLEALRHLAECERLLAGKAVALAAVAPASAPRGVLRAMVEEAGVASPVLLDEADALYGRWELRQHPVVVIVDRARRVHAVEPYRRIGYCDAIRARVRFLLGEIDRVALDEALRPPRAAMPTEVAGGSAGRWVKLGDRERARGNCRKALEAYANALEADPRNRAAHEGMKACGVEGRRGDSPSSPRPKP
ncbi:MAG TPA: hypothetical protein VH880_00235 [Anaeromyxobacteraceae bacterium]